MHVATDPKILMNLMDCRPVRIALGNFDGVHRGHRQLINQMVVRCKNNGESGVVVTFSPHPTQFFGRNSSFRKIDTPLIQQRLLAELGVGGLLILEFDRQLAEMSGMDFIEDILGVFPVREISVGPDFRFGRDRSGDVGLLAAEGHRRGFSVSVMDPVQIDGVTVSSSKVRSLIADLGDVATAATLLDRPFSLTGEVAHGNKLGRSIGFPTANLINIQQILPKPGVYAGNLAVRDYSSKEVAAVGWLPCVINIGRRPTVTVTDDINVEAHVYDYNGTTLNLYGETVEIQFVKRLRDELKFENIEALKRQISKDIDAARV